MFALVDCNNFYASCERVFQPQFNDRPLVVLSNNDGCVVARSNEAKRLQIGMGVPVFQIEHILEKHRVAVFSSNYALYGDMSRRVMRTLSEFTPDIEIYSIDEAFLNLAGFQDRDLTNYGQRICRTVGQWTGIPVSIGIAATKTLAKVANRMAKRTPQAHGVCLLRDDRQIQAALADLPVGKIWGVGSPTAKRLQANGIVTALDLRSARDSWIQQKFGVVGLRIVHELRGIRCYELEESPPAKKGITVSRSFGHRVESLEELEEATAAYAARAGEKLRAEKRSAGTMTVFVMTNLFQATETKYYNCHTVRFPVQTNDSSELIHYAIKAVRKLYRKGCRFKKSGVMLDNLVPQNKVQLNLFDTRNRQRSGRLMRALDAINRDHPLSPLHFAADGIRRPWQAKFNHRSARYTTRFDELLEVKAVN